MDEKQRKAIDEVKNRLKRAKTYTQGWHENIERWRKLYNMQHYDKKPKQKEIQYNDPTYTNSADLAVGIIMGNELQWHAYGLNPSKEEQAATGQMEKLIDGTIQVNNEREEAHLLFELYMNFVRDGGGVVYSVYDQGLADSVKEEVDIQTPEGPVRKFKFSEVPIRTQIIDPLKISVLPGGPKRWVAVCREEDRSVLDIETQYDIELPDTKTYRLDDKATVKRKFQDIWDYSTDEDGKLKVRNTRIFGSTIIFGPQFMDGYTDIPYTIQFFKPTEEGSSRWSSLLAPLESSVSMLERSINRRTYQIDVYSSLPLIAKAMPGKGIKIDPGLYNIMTIGPDEGIEFPNWPGNAPDVDRNIEFIRSRIQQSGFSDIMFGGGSGDRAGYALSQLGDQNKIRLQQPIQHLELLLTIWAKKILKLLQEFAPGTVICVYGKQKGEDYIGEIDLDRIKGYSIKAEIRPNFPNEEVRRVAMSTQVKGTVSDYTRMSKYLGIEQPEDEEKRKLIEAVTNHPVSIQYAIMAELMERVKNGDMVAAMTLQSLQNGMQGQAGRPEAPNKPEQLTGLAGPTGETPPQASGGSPPGQSDLENVRAAANMSPSMSGGLA